MDKNNSYSDVLILIHSKYSIASVEFEEKISKYITGKICVDNQWSRTRILDGGITKVPSLVYIKSTGAKTILQGIDECNKVLENLGDNITQTEEEPVIDEVENSTGAPNTTKIQFEPDENIVSSDIEEQNDLAGKNSNSSVMEKAQQMQQSREN